MNRIHVIAKGGTADFDADAGERILHAGLRAGAGLPYECATGTCGSCRATVVSGEVERLWPGAPGAKSFRGSDTVLACQVAARGNVVLSLKGELAAARRNRPGYVRGHVSGSRRHTADVAEFTVSLESPLAYTAGQFVLLEFQDLEGPRAYSPITRPGVSPDRLHLLVRAGRSGGASGRLFGLPADGLPVRVFGPLGAAVFDPADDRAFVAVAGGSGIAGILSILDEAAGSGHLARRPSALVFGLRGPDGAYLLDDLARHVRLAEGGLSVTVAFSDRPAYREMLGTYPELSFSGGFAHETLAGACSHAGEAALFYVAGPPPMVDATLRALVIDRRISPKDIRYDRFG